MWRRLLARYPEEAVLCLLSTYKKSFKIDWNLIGLSDSSLILYKKEAHYKPLYLDSKSLSDI